MYDVPFKLGSALAVISGFRAQSSNPSIARSTRSHFCCRQQRGLATFSAVQQVVQAADDNEVDDFADEVWILVWGESLA
eukprot:3360816-Amphidinium_carterae.1